MGISREEFADILREKFESSYLKLKDIPTLDLYIDQITTLFDDALSDRKRSEDEKILTKTMVNNYSKEKILLPIKSKKYSREHIIQMSMIYLMKQTLSIQDIKQIFSCEESSSLTNFEKVYENFMLFDEEYKQRMATFFTAFSERIDTENPEELLASMLYLCYVSSTLERVVETLIDKHLTCNESIKDKK